MMLSLVSFLIHGKYLKRCVVYDYFYMVVLLFQVIPVTARVVRVKSFFVLL